MRTIVTAKISAIGTSPRRCKRRSFSVHPLLTCACIAASFQRNGAIIAAMMAMVSRTAQAQSLGPRRCWRRGQATLGCGAWLICTLGCVVWYLWS